MSPELALVDAMLAAELRARAVVDAPLQTAAHIDDPPMGSTIDVDASDLIVAPFGGEDNRADPVSVDASLPATSDVLALDIADPPIVSADASDASDLIVDAAGGEDAAPTGSSWYPPLPAPVSAALDPMDAAEAALREIRDRLTTSGPVSRHRRFRRRLIVASGVTTFCAVGVLAANVFLGMIRLPL